MINTKTGTLRRDPETKKYAMQSEKRLSEYKSLCSLCGQNDTCPSSTIDDRDMHVSRCEFFIPPLKFSVNTGLELPEFNTLRLGTAWHKRLNVGDTVALINVYGERIKFCSVDYIEAGSKGWILANYADSNHLVKDMNLERPFHTLVDMMPKVFGPLVWSLVEELTVIGLKDYE